MIIHNECWIYRCIGCCSYLHKINPFHSHAPIYFNYFAFSLSCNTCFSVLEGIQKMETSAQNGSTPVVWQKFCTHHTAWKVSILGVFLVRICPYSDWLNAEKYGLEKLRIRTLFKQRQVIKIAPRNNFFFRLKFLHQELVSTNIEFERRIKTFFEHTIYVKVSAWKFWEHTKPFHGENRLSDKIR